MDDDIPFDIPEGGSAPGGSPLLNENDNQEDLAIISNGASPQNGEGVLEGIVTEDGQMEVDMEEDQCNYKCNLKPKGSPRKMVASKSASVAKMPDNRLEEKKARLEEFQNGSPKSHKIKASKMVNLKKAQTSNDGNPEDAIEVLSSDDEEMEENTTSDAFGIHNGQKLGEGNSPVPPQKKLDVPYQNGDKRFPVGSTQGTPAPRDIEEGERVYCEYAANKRYYWGQIFKRTKKKKSRFFKYHVRFDDGDEQFDVSSTKMVTVAEYIASFGQEAYQKALAETAQGLGDSLPAFPTQTSSPAPAAAAVLAGADTQPMPDQTRMTTKELLEQACGSCENCTKPRCGSCGICKVNGLRQGKEDRCCYQKMCCKIPEQSKLQSYTGLPKGIGFCFKESASNPQYEGLCFVSKGGRKYRTFENVFFGTKPDEKTIKKFYAFVGLEDRYKGGATSNSEERGGASATTEGRVARAKPAAGSEQASPHELWVERCKKCQNCTKPDCSKCICCRGNKRDPTATNCCFQKMCLGIDLARRAQPIPATFGSFPPGWTFAFDAPRSDLPHLEGLILFAPNTRRYASVDRAMNHNKTALMKVDKSLFYSYVGLPPNVAERKPADSTSVGAVGQAKRPASDVFGLPQPKKTRVVPTDVPTGLSLRELYERRCRNCSMCQKPSCKQCQACKENGSLTRTFKNVCFQKMCCEIKDEDKAQLAKGFPPGWRFYYTDPGKLSWNASGEHTGLAGLVLLSPTGRQFNSVESAEIALDADEEVSHIARTFYGYVGCHAVVAVTDHVLLGKPFRQSWVDVEGKTKMVYGNIVDVSEDLLSGGLRTATVEFSQKSRSLLNAGFTPNGASIPTTQKIPENIAFGGCLDCDPRSVRFDKIPYHLSWQVPDVRHEGFVVDEHGMFSPRLTMHFRGYHLVFTARTSTIPNAGKGVFVSCSTLTGTSNDCFVLNAGELLDLGVYAPFRRSDKKSAHVFLMKNFIHNSECEEWNFDTVVDENLFDITDDATGKLHEIASRHIPCYVNETDGHSTASVFAQHDPEGCVHYLLGHGSEGDGPFTLPANGVEQEIFIDYGETYEDVRVRKNYSRLSEAEANNRRRELDLDYKEVLVEMKTYNATEIIQCINFMMRDVFYPNRQYPSGVVIRSLLATVLFRKRAESFVEEFASLPVNDEEDDVAASVCHNGFSRDRMELVIQKSKNLIKSLFQFCNSWHQVKETLLSNEMYRTSLEYVLGEEDYQAMSPEHLGELIVGNEGYQRYSHTHSHGLTV